MTHLARRSPATPSDVAAFQALAPEDQQRVRGLVSESMAESTRRSYTSHISGWMRWCRQRGYEPLPAADATVVAYLSYLAERPVLEGGKVRPSSIKAIRSAIATAHSIAGFSDPTGTQLVKSTMKGIMRRHQGGRVMNRARALTGAEVLAMAATTRGEGKELVDKRDAGLMLLAYGTLMRRSEVVALDVEDLERRRDGSWFALIRQSKTDQTGEGDDAEIPDVAVEAILEWLNEAGVKTGPVFRPFSKNASTVLPRRLSGAALSVIAKQRARLAGITGVDVTEAFGGTGKVSGHSFRRGAATELAEDPATTPYDVRDAGRWKSLAMPSVYVERRKRINRLSERLGLKPTTERSEQ